MNIPSIVIIVVVIVLLVIYFKASAMLRSGALTKEQEKKWRFIRISCTAVTLLICVFLLKDYAALS